MRLLDRYLLRELLMPLAFCLVGFLISFIAFDLFGKIAEFQRNKMTGGDVLEYYLYKTPEFLVTSYVLPMSLLLALLYALTNHARYNELTAMRAAAISLGRIAMPYFVTGVFFSLLVLFVNEQVVPESVDAAERVLLRHASNQPKAVAKIWQRNISFLNAVANRTWIIGAYHLQANVMVNPQFNWRMEDGRRVQFIAEKARWMNRQWVFTNVTRMEYAAENGAVADILKTNQMIFPGLAETPRIIKSEIKISALADPVDMRKAQLSSLEILDYLKLHPTLDSRLSARLLTKLHNRLAEPWICFVVALIAVPFGSLPGRRNAFVGVASSIFICFAFLIMKDLTLALGSGGFVPPWLAAWSPNAIFSATGLVLMWRVR